MKLNFLTIHGIVALLALAATANAAPILWTLNGVALSDGGTASGTFTFDPDAGTPCGSFGPCGTYSNVHIVTTAGASRTGATYSFVCGKDVVSCNGVSPDSTEVLFLTSNTANQTGGPAIAFFFTGVGVFPPQGLTDAGGVIDVSGSSGAVGIAEEASCPNASCNSPGSPVRSSVVGTVSAIPEPATWLLWVAGFTVMASLRRNGNRLLDKHKRTRQ